ncbi:MAG: ABC transporter ATP-binding protein, partial [Pseudomonadota bacterium]
RQKEVLVSFSAQTLTIKHGPLEVLSDVSLTLQEGEVTGLIGPNGVGKSSLLKALAGLAPATGTIAMNEAPMTAAQRRDSVAYMPQDSSAGSSLTLLEVVLLGRIKSLGFRVGPDLIASVEALLDDFGLAHLSHRTLDAVSGGQRQLTYLAQALFREPRILLLDEPTAALDLRNQLLVFETLRSLARDKGIAVVVALHDLSLTAQFCDQVACLCDGRLDAAGPPEEVLTKDRLARVYGIAADITSDAQKGLRIAALHAI